MHRHRGIRCHVGDPLTILVPVVGLDAGQVVAATWKCAGVSEEKDSVEVLTVAAVEAAHPDFQRPTLDGEPVGDDTAVLVVTVTPADTTSIGTDVGVRPRRFEWQAAAGAENPRTWPSARWS